METLKQSVIAALLKLPDSVQIDDMMYRMYVIDKIRKGQKAIENGETISIEDLEKEMESW